MLKLDYEWKSFLYKKIVLSSDKQKDIKFESTNDWTGEDESSYVIGKYYAIQDMVKDKFIHFDGSLHFEFCIKKHTLKQD